MQSSSRPMRCAHMKSASVLSLWVLQALSNASAGHGTHRQHTLELDGQLFVVNGAFSSAQPSKADGPTTGWSSSRCLPPDSQLLTTESLPARKPSRASPLTLSGRATAASDNAPAGCSLAHTGIVWSDGDSRGSAAFQEAQPPKLRGLPIPTARARSRARLPHGQEE